MTNADKIRAMSDEELAKFLCYFSVMRFLGAPVQWMQSGAVLHDRT